MKKNTALKSLKCGDRIFDIFNKTFMLLFALSCAYPFYYCIVLSFNDGNDALKGFIYFFPRVFTLRNYEVAFKDGHILNAYFITIIRTIIGTAVHVFFNAMVAYALTKKELYFRKFYITLGIITMYFGGGLIPTYILIRHLGLINNFLVYVIPGIFAFFHILLFMAFFKELPASLMESAKIDGANEFYIFIKIILPVSSAVLASVALFTGVGQWNSWFDAYIYTSKKSLRPMSLILVEMINENLAAQVLVEQGIRSVDAMDQMVTSNSLRLAVMVIATAPIMAVYPFLQKYFVKGVLIGSVKG